MLCHMCLVRGFLPSTIRKWGSMKIIQKCSPEAKYTATKDFNLKKIKIIFKIHELILIMDIFFPSYH